MEKVKDLTIPEGSCLVSFDVDSLFTMVPVKETLKYLEEIIPELGLNIPITNKKFIELVRLVLEDNVFVANDILQANGRLGDGKSPFSYLGQPIHGVL